MGCTQEQNHEGFTLVEISIVMIIIGLLIGGTFGGMKLIENMQVNKTVQDLKAIESAALTFKDTYGRLPGDMPNTAARLPNCTVAPCATGGNGNRRISPEHSVANQWTAALSPTWERFTFWSHLQAADMLAVGTKNTTDMNFGEGQPDASIGGGYRITEFTGPGGCGAWNHINGIILVTAEPSLDLGSSTNTNTISCASISAVDRKVDDGLPRQGRLLGHNCEAAAPCSSEYYPTSLGHIFFDAGF